MEEVWSSEKCEGPKVIAVPSSRVTVVAHRGKREREVRTEGPFRWESGMEETLFKFSNSIFRGLGHGWQEFHAESPVEMQRGGRKRNNRDFIL